MSERIDNKKDLQNLAKRLGTRRDWHEPDEQGITVQITGDNFDNAGFDDVEIMVSIFQHGDLKARVNLATLLSIACE